MRIARTFATTSLAALIALGTVALAQKEHPQGHPADKDTGKAAHSDEGAVIGQQKFSYPLTTCPITDKAIEPGKGVDAVFAGRMVRLCCAGCKDKVAKDQAAVFAKIDAAVIAAQKATYPLATCPISGEDLGKTAVDHVHGTRLVRFCSAACIADFNKHPEAAMAKVDEAYIKAQRASYPLDKCVISGEKLGGMGEPVERLYGTQLVRFCCKSCIKSFEKDPEDGLKQLAAAKHAAKK